MNREAIYTALFAKLSGVAGLATTSRRLKHYSEVSPSQQPAMYVTQASQFVKQIKGFPSEYTLEAKVWIYSHNTDTAISPATALNNLLDLVDLALRPSVPQDKQTLGGLVEHCWIDGEIVTDEGSLGDQAVAIFTIKILTTT